MANDEFAAMERWYKQKFPFEISSGEIASLSGGIAQVYVGGKSSVQPAYYDPAMILNPGDECILIRTKRSGGWCVNSVLTRRNKGSPDSTRETQNNKAGSRAFNKSKSNGGTTVTVNSATITSKFTDTFALSGGSLMVLFNGRGTLSSANGVLTMYVNILDDVLASEQVFGESLVLTNHPDVSVNWVHVIPGPIYGIKTIEIQAAQSAGSVSLVCYGWKVMEV